MTGNKRRGPRAIDQARSHFFSPEPDASPSRQRFFTIHRTLRDRVALLAYPPGMKLDIEALAAEFDVSRTPIRSVLQRLEYQGLVSTRHGVGTTVEDIDFERLREAMQFRMRLAELIGELSPKEPSEGAIALIEEAHSMCRGLGDTRDTEAFGRIDIQVHDAICALIGHPLLLQVYDELFFYTVRLWYFFMPNLDWRREVEIFLSDIESTGAAMRRGDTRAVGFLVRNALSTALIRLSDLLSEAEARAG